MARDSLNTMCRKVLPADLQNKCCGCLQATLKPAQWWWPTMKKTTIKIQIDNDDDDLVQWRDEDNNNDDHNSVRSLGRLNRSVGCQVGRTTICSRSWRNETNLPARVPICIHCRRRRYATVCTRTRTTTLLTRHQEWCVPFLHNTRLQSTARVLRIIQPYLASLLNADANTLPCLSRTAAGFEMFTTCTCHLQTVPRLSGTQKVERAPCSKERHGSSSCCRILQECLCRGRVHQCRWVGNARTKSPRLRTHGRILQRIHEKVAKNEVKFVPRKKIREWNTAAVSRYCTAKQTKGTNKQTTP